MAMAMSAAEAHATAEAKGLALLRAENATGFKYVRRDDRKSKPFQAQVKQDGRNRSLGNFTTAEEAALAVARFLGPEGVAAALAPAALEPAPMTAAEVHAAAAAEGLVLVRGDNLTGFKGVNHNGSASGNGNGSGNGSGNGDGDGGGTDNKHGTDHSN